MRFDDTLETVLAADLTTPYGVQSVWRQLVDLVGRRRVSGVAEAMATLREIKPHVPGSVRAASARALEYGDPPAPLVRLFAVDDLPIALPVLRSARLTSTEWVQLLPELAPGARHVLRNRRDLSPTVRRALESFGPADFVLRDESARIEAAAEAQSVRLADDETWAHRAGAADAADAFSGYSETAVQPAPAPIFQTEPAPVEAVPALAALPELDTHDSAEPDLQADAQPEPLSAAGPFEEAAGMSAEAMVYWHSLAASFVQPALPAVTVSVLAGGSRAKEDLSFVALADAAPTAPERFGSAMGGDMPEAAPALEAVQGGADAQEGGIGGEDAPARADSGDLPPAETLSKPFAEAGIADSAEAPGGEDEGTFEIADVVARIDAFWRDREENGATPRPPVFADNFRFETDATGVIRWVDGVSRAPVVGLRLDLRGLPDGSRVDGVAAGAFRSRASFTNARLWIEGDSDAAGDWLISAVPVFDPDSGRFTGYRGTARRPRTDERAEPMRPPPPANAQADSLRQLVHELRTPTNAIAGFAEMIETQMLGPVPDPYRGHAHVIRTQAKELLGAIDDLDLAARIDSDALALVPGRVALRQVLAGIADDLAQLSELRGSMIALPIDDLAVIGDRRAVERLLSRLMATLVSATVAGERIGVYMALDNADHVSIAIDRPSALADYQGDSVLGIDDEREDSTLLGTGFALRLSRNLARELGGSLMIASESLTLRLPAAVTAQVGQAHLS